MIIRSAYLHNPEHKKLDLPKEDYFLIKKYRNRAVIVVADGITRDPKGVRWLPDKKEPEFLNALKKYPKPSPAFEAARLFCISFCNYAKDNDIKTSFILANKNLKKLNKGKVNYLDNDYAGCVASLTIIEKNSFYWGFITDCGFAYFNSHGKLIFKTKVEMPSKLIKSEAKRRNLLWNDSKWRYYVRKHFRNNLSEPNSYGALTGEESAENYIRIGKFKVEKGNYIALYSDGMKSIIDSKSFNPRKIFNNLKKYITANSNKIDGGEGTIVIVKL